MKILLVEDDPLVAQSLKLLLSSHTYAVDLGVDGENGLQMVDAFEYDLIVLDVVLPGLDGIQLCKKVRAAGHRMPILLLTGQRSAQQKAIALNAGADDYVVKPFDPGELLARVNALLRRGDSVAPTQLTWGNLCIDPGSHNVTYGTQLVFLTAKEYAILELFLRHHQSIFSTRALLDQVWESTATPEETVIRFHIKELRRKLETAGAPKDFIKTVHGVGYRLNPLYSSTLATQPSETFTETQVAELKAINEELRLVLEQLRSTEAELHQKNQELQAARDNLELRVRERTAELLQTNAELQEKEARLQRLTANVAGMVYQYILHPDGSDSFTYVSPRCRDIYELEAEELLQHFDRVWQMIHPADVERVQQANFSSAQRLERFDIEFRLLPPSGRLRWVRAISQPEQQPNGDVIWDGLVLDITAQKATEASLRMQEEQLQLALDLNEIGSWNWHLSTGDIIWNDFGCQLLGYQPGDRSINYQGCRELIHPDDVAEVEAKLAQALEHQTDYEAEFRIVLQDGTIRWVLDKGRGLYDESGQAVRMLGFCFDITDRKGMEADRRRAEVELQESEQRYHQILDTITDMVLVKGLDSQIVWANKAFRDYYNMSLEELQGIIDAPFNDPDYTQQYIRDDTFVFTTGETLEILEESVTRHDGVARPFSTIKTPIFDENGQVILTVGVSRDITERKAIESELHQRQAFLSSIYNGAEQAIFVLEVAPDGKLRYLSFNRVAELYAERTNQQIQGATPEEAFGSVIGQVFQQNYERCLQAGSSIAYEEYIEFENRIIWTLTTLSPLRDESGEIYRIVGTSTDITEQKHLELSLQRSEAKLNQILNSVISAITNFKIFANRDWEYNYFSPACESLFGYTIQEIMADKNLWFSRVHPEDRERVLVPLFEDFFAERNISVEYRFFRKDGALRWISSTFSSQKVEPDCWLVTTVGNDITDRKQAEIELKESQKFVEQIAESTAAILYVYDLVEQRNIYVNPQITKILGYSPEQVQAMGSNLFSNLVHPDDLPLVQEKMEQCLSLSDNEVIEVEYRMQCTSGDWRWIQSRNSLLNRTPEGTAKQMIGIAVDITDRKQAEQKVLEQAALLDIASDAIFVHGLDQRILYWNQGAERLYGWTAAEAIGQAVDTLLQANPTSVKKIMAILIEQGEYQGEISNVTKAGKKVTIEGRWTLVRDESGQPKSVLVVNTDITEKKQLEAQFYRAQRLESLGTLASGIAHDLNNALTPILTVAQLMRIHEPDLDEQAQELLQILEVSAKRGADMVKQITTFVRGTDGKRIKLQVAHLLQEITKVTRQTFPKSIEVRTILPTQPLWLVSADPTHLHQVLMNLCVNARDAMPEGGILTILAQNYCLDATAAQAHLDARSGEYVVITVSDTGSGIPEEFRDRVLDPFFTTKEAGKGTGLGLSTSLGIVKSYGGFLEIESEVGTGTQIKVYLPVAEGTPTQVEKSAPCHRGNGELILIVDDDVAVQTSNRSLLEKYGYKTLVASDGQVAISLYQQHYTAIRGVLIDVMMPNLDGVATIHILKQINPQVKIIAISGLLSNQSAVLDAGADQFLVKPYAIDDLTNLVYDLIHHNLSAGGQGSI